MKKIFDLTTLLLILGVAALAYIGYNDFYLKRGFLKKPSEKEEIMNTGDRVPKIVRIDPSITGDRGEDVFSPTENSEPLSEADVVIGKDGIQVISGQGNDNEKTPAGSEIPNDNPAPSGTQTSAPTEPVQETPTTKPETNTLPIIPPIEEERTPKDPTIPEEKLIPEEPEPEEEEPEYQGTPGFYENTTYNYNISYPTDWPIKIRREDNISVGTIPPKDGQGAITIEVADDMSNEIEEAKAEAKRYPGIITIKEMPIIIDGTAGTKMTLYNSTNNLTDVYIYLEKYGHYYAIKYSEESPAFVSEVEEALTSFNFTK